MKTFSRIPFAFILCQTLVLSAVSLFSQTISFDDPIDYNDFIVDQQNAIGEQVLIFNDVMGDPASTETKIRDAFKAVINQVNSSIENTNQLKPFEEGLELKLAALELFRFYKSAFEIEYARIMEIVILGDYTQADLDEVDKLIAEVGAKEVPADRRFTVAQEAFAKKYDFGLDENEFQQKFDSLTKEE